MKRLSAINPLWIAVAIALLVLAWLASGMLGSEKAPSVTPQAPVQQFGAGPVRVATQRSRAKPVVEKASVTARTAPVRAVDLRAETQGRVTEVAARRGARLEQGDLIVRLAVNDRRAQLAKAKALLEQRELQYQAAQKLSEKGYQTRSGVAEARANLESARADVASMQDDLANTAIRAPFAGVLETRPVEVGNLVRVGDDIGRLVQQSPFLVVGDVPENVVARISVGQPGSARLVSGETVQGHVRFVAGEADPQTRTYAVELEVAHDEGRLIAGATATLQLPLGKVPAHVVEPGVLTLNENGEFGIKAVDESGRAVFYPATVVRNRDGKVWLTDLPKQLEIITVGQGFVRAGDRVEAVDESEEDGIVAGPARAGAPTGTAGDSAAAP